MSDLAGITQIVAQNSSAALAFNDPAAADEILSALRVKPHVTSASITREDGSVFAHFGRAENAETLRSYPRGNGFVFDRNYLLHSQDIVLDDEKIGMLYLRSDYRSVYVNLLKLYLGILAAVLVASSLLAFVISSRLQRLVSEPILELVQTARVIADKKDYSVRAKKMSSDELGLFTDAFNQMLTQIETQDHALLQAQHTLEQQVIDLTREISDRKRAETDLASANAQLVETSRRAGMAEVATGVLHNVGNVLNSVNVSATLVSDRVRQSRAGNLTQASGLLQEHADHLDDFIAFDPRGKQLLEYLPNLGAYLQEERAEMLKELESLTKNLDHIKDIVSMQQGYARVSGIIEPVSIVSLAEDALQIHQAALVRHRVTVVREFEEVPPVHVDKHKVLQILINLIRNAKYAMDELGQPDKRLRVAITTNGDQCVQVIISDNGQGILAENLIRIFAHGFTTKHDGHGFGLHSCALAAQEMNGSLVAHSDGVGKGATFTLQLPIARTSEG